jgi:quinol monooxygenase YgiN
MAVQVHIKRKVSEKQVPELEALLKKLRALTLNRKGYISGRTFNRVDQPGVSLVIGTWQSADDWKEWAQSNERIDLQEKIDKLLGQPTEYEIFQSI